MAHYGSLPKGTLTLFASKGLRISLPW